MMAKAKTISLLLNDGTLKGVMQRNASAIVGSFMDEIMSDGGDKNS